MDKQFFLQRAEFVRMMQRKRKHAEKHKEETEPPPEPPQRTVETHSRVKVIKSGPVYELYEYEKAVNIGKRENAGGRTKASEGPSERCEANRRQAMREATNTVRRLVNANFDTTAKFVTLTFRDQVREPDDPEIGEQLDRSEGERAGGLAGIRGPHGGTADTSGDDGGRVKGGDAEQDSSGRDSQEAKGRPPLGVDVPPLSTESQVAAGPRKRRKTSEESSPDGPDENEGSMSEWWRQSQQAAEQRRSAPASRPIRRTTERTQLLDIRDVTQTRKEFKDFIKRLRRLVAKQQGGRGDFRYIAVTEFQDENRNGVVHFHMIADLPYIKQDILAQAWGHGFVGVNFVEDTNKVGKYLTKYIQKSFDDVRLQGYKTYLNSQGLERPLELHGHEAEQVAGWLHEENKRRVYENVYPSEWCGRIHYIEYNTREQTNEQGDRKQKKNFPREKKESVGERRKRVTVTNDVAERAGGVEV